MPTQFDGEENSASKPRRRPSPATAISMDTPRKLRTSDLAEGPLSSSRLEISDQDPSVNYYSASRSSSSLLRVLTPTTPRGFLLLSFTLLLFFVTVFPHAKNRYYEEASLQDSTSDFITKKDLGPHKKAHVFVKPGNVKKRHNDGITVAPDEVASDEIKESSSSTVKSHQEGVPPISGLAYLTPAEFRDVRLARPNESESVLLTGGLGFIGSHVVDLLLHRGFKVTILDDESNGHNHNKFCREMVPKDITVVGDLPKFPTGEEDSDEDVMYFTHVIHLAAAISVAESMNDPEKYERINFGGSQKVLDWVRGYNGHVSSLLRKSNNDKQQPSRQRPTLIRKIVAASSAAIYGDPDPSLLPLREPTPYGGLSPYADTKYRMEGLMRGFVDGQNADNKQNDDGFVPAASATALRFFNVYGPRQDPKNPYSGVISLFLEMASNDKNITILGDGLMTRDFVYVKDVARAVVMALLQEKDEKEPASFSVYNVCTGTSITINTLAEQVKQSMGSSSDIVHLDPREGDIRDSRCNPGGAAKGMAFVAAVSQEEGLEKTANWFREANGSRLLMERRGDEISSRRLEEEFYPELI